MSQNVPVTWHSMATCTILWRKKAKQCVTPLMSADTRQQRFNNDSNYSDNNRGKGHICEQKSKSAATPPMRKNSFIAQGWRELQEKL